MSAIGTTNPLTTLHVQGKSYFSNGLWLAGGDLTSMVNSAPWYGVGLSSLNFGAATVQVASWGGLNFQTAGGQMVIRGDSGYVGINTTTPQHRLQVAGTIGAQEVIVSSTGADYVFKPDYRLTPLSEVASYIKDNQHLPDIPSEAEVKEKGIGIGEMQTKLLAKIEELTLHVIQEHDRNDRLEQRNHELEERLVRLEARDGAMALKPNVQAEKEDGQ